MPAAAEAGPAPAAAAWWSWFNSVLVLSLIPWLSAVAWRNLQRLQLHHLVGRQVSRRLRWLAAAFVDPYLTVTVDEHDTTGRMMRQDDAYYEEVKAYLGASCSRTARHLRAQGASRDVTPAAAAAAGDRIVLSMIEGEEVADHFGGATVWWSAHFVRPASRNGGGAGSEERSFKLHYHERHRELVLDTYLAFVQQRGRDIMVNSRQRLLYTNVPDHRPTWSQVTYKHPMRFDKLAMDPAKKKEVMDDLDTFKNGKEHYERSWKPWKRGYLRTARRGRASRPWSPPWPTTSSTTSTSSSSRRLLMKVKTKAVIVIEDIDCSLDLTGAREKKKKKKKAAAAEDDDKKNGGASSTSSSAAAEADTGSKVTLSGLLNVVDGLLSACGEEQIFVFTTNHLLGEVDMTPADVIEELTPKSKDDDVDSCLAALLKALEKAKEDKKNRGSSA
ncbi:hypothetical protein HU200_005837 [Digitaria exilis]|uniref:Uncharacterized protein n=1 Tax=Digitaria exilis TaxID=1010633 RepID=A0A835FR35_9POAL|nr:hypothetical protein HU200_005837 [Digitaria exilis]CAB3492836.1 unnamed protein product [Digitaria exilis]